MGFDGSGGGLTTGAPHHVTKLGVERVISFYWFNITGLFRVGHGVTALSRKCRLTYAMSGAIPAGAVCAIQIVGRRTLLVHPDEWVAIQNKGSLGADLVEFSFSSHAAAAFECRLDDCAWP